MFCMQIICVEINADKNILFKLISAGFQIIFSPELQYPGIDASLREKQSINRQYGVLQVLIKAILSPKRVSILKSLKEGTEKLTVLKFIHKNLDTWPEISKIKLPYFQLKGRLCIIRG